MWWVQTVNTKKGTVTFEKEFHGLCAKRKAELFIETAYTRGYIIDDNYPNGKTYYSVNDFFFRMFEDNSK